MLLEFHLDPLNGAGALPLYYPPFILSNHYIHKSVNVRPSGMVSGKYRGEKFSHMEWVLSVSRVMVFPVKQILNREWILHP